MNTFKKLEYDGTDSPRLKLQMEAIEEQIKNFDQDVITTNKQSQKRTVLEKLIRSAFGNNVPKIYKAYPDLKLLTQPNYPVISPRGQEIIKRSMFRESLALLDEVVQPMKEQDKIEKKMAKLKSQQQLQPMMSASSALKSPMRS